MTDNYTLRLDQAWLFHFGDAADADYMGYDDRAWRPVTLPHDWAVEHPFDRCHSSGTGYLPGGIAWYRKHLVLDDSVQGKRVRLTFQGIYKHAKVWFNSNYLGQHAYGYTSFTLDVSEFARPGENVIAVRVEHSETADSRWYTGSGINRHVFLDIADPVSFDEGGIFVSTLQISEQEALLRVQYRTSGGDAVRFRLLDPEGRPVSDTEAGGENGTAELRVSSPSLWHPDSPALYRLEGEVLSCGRVTDRRTVPVGIRTFRFDPDLGFFLNGVPMKIKGVCVHHDAGCLGAAVPKAVWRRRLEKLKAMGCNALRTAHNPPDPDLLDLCDELGFLVMDEAFDEWEGIKNKWWQGHNVYPPKHFGYGEDFPLWHEADLRSMVLRDRNHPSVILWSIGNEIDYPNDPYVTPLFHEVLGNNDAGKPAAERVYDSRKPDAGRLAVIARKLVRIVHDLDDTRPVTSALSFPELSNRTGYADVLDLSGYNYREQFYEQDHKTWPGRVILGSENSHDPEAWRAVTEHEYISGQFLWTGVDFLGECPGWPKRISQAGALDLAGFEKTLYDQRKALWTAEPCLRLAVSDAAEDHGAWREHRSWQGESGCLMRVSCYTNLPEAELFLNGASLGCKAPSSPGGCRITWEVPYAPGTLSVRSGELEDRLSTPVPASAIRCSAIPDLHRGDEMEVLQVEVSLADSENRPALDDIVHCQVTGGLELLGIENGIPDDLTPYSMPYRSTHCGRLIVYLRRTAPSCGEECLYLRTASGLRQKLCL